MQELSPVPLNKQTILSKTSSTRRTSNGTPGKRPTKQRSNLRKLRLIKEYHPRVTVPFTSIASFQEGTTMKFKRLLKSLQESTMTTEP